MSLFGSIMGDFEDDPIFGQHMRSMRQMNTMMNSMFADPFAMFNPFDAMNNVMGPSALTGAPQHPLRHHAMMPFGFPAISNMNRLLNTDLTGDPDGALFSSSRVVTMTQGPDGRPQVYQASSTVKNGPGGLRETRKTVEDSRTGVKKMAIGHHIGERSHIIERERNLHTGDEEERQDFINIEEEEADRFNQEFKQRASRNMLPIGGGGSGGSGRRTQVELPAIMPAQDPSPSSNSATYIDTSSTSSPSTNNLTTSPLSHSNHRRGLHRPLATSRRPLRTPASSPLALPSSNDYASTTTSIHPHPYNPSGRRNHRPMKGQQTAPTQYPTHRQHERNGANSSEGSSNINSNTQNGEDAN